MTDTQQTERLDPKVDYTVVYTLTLTVKRAAVPADPDEDTSADVVPEMVEPKAFRQLEREVLHCLNKLDGDCDVEVIDYTTEEE